MFQCRSGIKLHVSNTTNAHVWQLEFSGMKSVFTGINTPNSKGFGAELGATVFIELEIGEADNNYMNSITDFLHVIILTHRQEALATFIPDNPVSTKQYLAPIGPRNESASIAINDVLPSLDQYYVYFVNQAEIMYEVKGQIVIKNSFGHLDVDERYFPLYSQLGFFVQSIGLLIWCNLLWTRRKYIVTVHIFLAAYILLKAIEKWLCWKYSEKLNRTGDLIRTEIVLVSLCQDLLDVLGLSSMLMYSCGYQMREQVERKKVRLFLWTAVSYVFTCVAQSFCYLSPDVCHLIFLMRFIFGTCLLLGVVWLINALSSIIQFELHSEPFVESTKLIYLQLARLKAVRAGFLTYVISPIVLMSFLYTFLLWQDLSILVLIKDLILLPFIEVFILYNLRPSKYMIRLSQ